MQKNTSGNNFIFFGTPELSVIVLGELAKEELLPLAVVTRADSPQGRGQRLAPSPVKEWAMSHHLPVLAPQKATNPDFLDQLRAYHADAFVVAAYGKILRPALLAIPRLTPINVHPSLLPEYRGPSPIQGALKDGKRTTGVTIMLMDEEMDHGDILAQREVAIAQDDNAITLTEKLAHEGGRLLAKTLTAYLGDNITPRAQEHGKATYTTLLTKADGRIGWDASAQAISNHIRAYQGWPTAWTELHEKGAPVGAPAKRVKILAALAIAGPSREPVGVLVQKNGGLAVAVRDGYIHIHTLQFEGKGPISGAEFASRAAATHGQFV